VALVAGIVGIGAGAAHAEILGKGSFSWHDEGDIEECGLSNLYYRQDGSLHFVTRVGTGSQTGLFPGHANFAITTKVTNVDNGKWFTIVERFVSVQPASTNLGGTLWVGTSSTFTGTVTWYDSDGRVVLRDAGRETSVSLFDDGGDGEPGTDLIAELEHRFVGHHPLYDMTEQEACAVQVGLIG
jgi:hypothetical protein